jgi:hypothetical protein
MFLLGVEVKATAFKSTTSLVGSLCDLRISQRKLGPVGETI